MLCPLHRQQHFYPRSPCGERLDTMSQPGCTTHFYPRSPCGERRRLPINNSIALQFLSTLSLRRATRNFIICLSFFGNFYPRSPCGERRRVDLFFSWCIIISIHALLAESDHNRGVNLFRFERIISIHALLAESDALYRFALPKVPSISIHALLAESDFGRAFWPGLSL